MNRHPRTGGLYAFQQNRDASGRCNNTRSSGAELLWKPQRRDAAIPRAGRIRPLGLYSVIEIGAPRLGATPSTTPARTQTLAPTASPPAALTRA